MAGSCSPSSPRVLRDPDPGAVGRFTGSLRVLGPLVLAPATVAVLGLRIGLIVDTEAWDFGQLWVQLGLGLFGAAFVIGAVWQSRSALAATRAAARDDNAEARRQLRRWLAGYWLVVALLVAALWDMTTKPGCEGRRDERSAMSKVLLEMSVSLDGFVAEPEIGPGAPLGAGQRRRLDGRGPSGRL